jgi:catechol 2,3-dioxygenase-like lactoylglutathione lyase family enzyme
VDKEETVSVPRLVHIAMRTEDPPRLASFYQDMFEMTVARNLPRVVDLWDGNIFLAINPIGTGKAGLEHFGFQVNDLDSMRSSLKQAGASTPVSPRPAGRSFADCRVHDPEGNPVDLSDRGYNTVPAEKLKKKEKAAPTINELVIVSESPSSLALFYKNAFGMEVVERAPTSMVVTDGSVRIVLLSRAHGLKPGLLCFSFHGEDKKRTAERLEQMGIKVSSGSPWDLASTERFSFHDPAGNLLTVS